MRSTTFILLLLLTSGLLFAPAVQVEEEVTLAPQEATSLLLLIRSTTIEMSTNIQSTVFVNISYVTPSGDVQILQTNAQLVKNYQITLAQTGTYQITLLSTNFGVVNIDQAGITTYQLIYYTVLVISFLFVFNRRRVNS